jgi:hypothetical protein
LRELAKNSHFGRDIERPALPAAGCSGLGFVVLGGAGVEVLQSRVTGGQVQALFDVSCFASLPHSGATFISLLTSKAQNDFRQNFKQGAKGFCIVLREYRPPAWT